MTLVYRAGAQKAPTDVFVPQRQYPTGYRVVVSGGRVISKPNATHLLVIARPNTTVTVTVTPPH